MICDSQVKVFLFIKVFIELLNIVVSTKTNYKTFTLEDNEILFERETNSDDEIIFHPKFPTNVHELMTPDEIFDTFGTNGSVPEYHVFPMKFSKGRKKRDIADEVTITVDIKGNLMNLNLKATDGLLATRYTPVWQAYTDSRAYNQIRYHSFPYAMTEIGDFKMYQDPKNEAAIVIYRNNNNIAILEGVVTPNYIVKSLPERFSQISIKDNPKYSTDKPTRQERSTEDDDYEITGHYVLVKVESSLENFGHQSPQLKLKRRRQRQTPLSSREKVPEIIYPEILLVIDYNAISKQSLTQALRFILAFWNAIDMIYSALEEPKIRLNIAGIIISADDTAAPYIANNTSIKFKGHDTSTTIRIGQYFYQERDRFPITYDILIGMTTINFCSEKSDSCSNVLGFANFESSCKSLNFMKFHKRIDSIGVFTYSLKFFGLETAAHETAHIIGVDHDDDDSKNCQGYLMMPKRTQLKYHFKWSPCSKLAFTNIFSNNGLRCMDNKPVQTKSIFKLMTDGYWLTLDGQCRNYGFRKSCELPGKSPCEIQGCQTEDSNECIQSEFAPLPGSKCGENMHCDITSKCVHD